MITRLSLPGIPLFTSAYAALQVGLKVRTALNQSAIIDPDGVHFSYWQLYYKVFELLELLRSLKGHQVLDETRVAYMLPPGFSNVAVLWAIWGSGGIAVPLCTSHPSKELEYTITDSQAEILIAHPNFTPLLEPIATRYGLIFHQYQPSEVEYKDKLADVGDLKLNFEPFLVKRRALIIYTSGTTGKPKGVVSTHQSLTAQLEALTRAWRYSRADKIYHFLPLHHIHGLINALTCVLYNGGTVEFAPRFASDKVWERILAPDQDLTLFMAVPTIYSKLAQEYDRQPQAWQQAATLACSQFRLMVSGSSALPGPLFQKWRAISGHTLLERYGMSEIGMGLTNPLEPSRRVEGHVGTPFPTVEARIVSDTLEAARAGAQLETQPGELQIRGPSLFKEYWNRPEATQEAFTEDGWFKTGDTAICTSDGVYKILGRSSVDILKTNGYKVSALEVEKEILAHPDISDCAVIGVPDPQYGEKVTAVLVSRSNELPIEGDHLKEWLSDKLARYKVPVAYIPCNAIPKNAMGKVNKKELLLWVTTHLGSS